MHALVALAQQQVEIVGQPEPVRDTYDLAVFSVAALAAFGTVGAVLVAMFGPGLRARQRIPKVTLKVDARMSQYGTEGARPEEALGLRLHNERKRDTAREVEVFISMLGDHGPQVGSDGSAIFPTTGDSGWKFGRELIARQRNLNFNSPLEGHIGSRTATIPAGFNREVYFAIVGSRLAIARTFHGEMPVMSVLEAEEAVAALCLYPARTDLVAYLSVPPGSAAAAEYATAEHGDTATYEVTLTVTGANFDAQTYQGSLYAVVDQGDDKAGRGPSVELGWASEPALVTDLHA